MTDFTTYLSDEFQKPYFLKLTQFLHAEKSQNKIIFPHSDHRFRAFDLTKLADIKVVILGQDPYHGDNQAHGLCFSVHETMAIPPSLRNIFKEIKTEFPAHRFTHGNLENWAKQGVFLLNSVLSVEKAKAGSHANQGWEIFTNNTIRFISDNQKNIVFLLWGAYAQKKSALINADRHLILTAPHPSPLSAYRGFFGCGHFAKANNYLKKCGKTPINWQN